MAAGKHTSAEVVVSFNSKDITQYVTEINGVDLTAGFEDSTPLGSAFRTQAYGGVSEIADITIKGFYDDTTTSGPHAVLGTIGTTGALVITWGNSKTTTLTAAVKSYSRDITVGSATKFTAVLVNTTVRGASPCALSTVKPPHNGPLVGSSAS